MASLFAALKTLSNIALDVSDRKDEKNRIARRKRVSAHSTFKRFRDLQRRSLSHL